MTAAGEATDRRPRRLRRIWRYVVPAFALVLVVIGVVQAGPAWSAAHGGGTLGTLTMQENVCGRRTCTWHGQFRSDDQSVVRNDVVLHDTVPDGTHTGDELRTRDTGDRTGVFLAAGSQAWRGPILLIVGAGAVFLGWSAWLAVLAMLAKRRERALE